MTMSSIHCVRDYIRGALYVRLCSLIAVVGIMSVGLVGCSTDQSPEPQGVQAQPAAAPAPGQAEPPPLVPSEVFPEPFANATALGISGAFRGLDDAAMDLIRGVTRVVNLGMPDVRTTLQGLEKYIEKSLPESERLGKRLREIKKSRSRRSRRQYKRINAERFAPDIAEYRKALAEFEKHADDTEILELNGLIKKLTQPMRPE